MNATSEDPEKRRRKERSILLHTLCSSLLFFPSFATREEHPFFHFQTLSECSLFLFGEPPNRTFLLHHMVEAVQVVAPSRFCRRACPRVSRWYWLLQPTHISRAARRWPGVALPSILFCSSHPCEKRLSEISHEKYSFDTFRRSIPRFSAQAKKAGISINGWKWYGSTCWQAFALS